MACLRPVSTVAHTLLQAAIKLALPQRTWDPSSLGTLAAPAAPPPPHAAPRVPVASAPQALLPLPPAERPGPSQALGTGSARGRGG